jgi:hypothetical protein
MIRGEIKEYVKHGGSKRKMALKYTQILKKMEEVNSDAVILTGLDSCIVGICNTFEGSCFLYSEDKIVQLLMKEMTEEEAIKYYEFDILNVNYGEYSPVFLVSKDDIE